MESLYLAVDWSEKEGLTQLFQSAAQARDIKELLQHFKPVAGNTFINVFLISKVRDQTESVSYESDSVSGNENHVSDTSQRSIKKKDQPMGKKEIKLCLKLKVRHTIGIEVLPLTVDRRNTLQQVLSSLHLCLQRGLKLSCL